MFCCREYLLICLQTDSLRLIGCNLSDKSRDTLASVLSHPYCTLKDLDLSNNDLQDSGVTLFNAGQHCCLETLRFDYILVYYKVKTKMLLAVCSGFIYLYIIINL